MQSILQYRNLKKEIQRQFASHRVETSKNAPPATTLHRDPLEPSHTQTDEPKIYTPGEQTHTAFGDGLEDTEPGPNEFCMVSFNDDNDKNNPRNWTFGQKSRATVITLGAGIVGGWPSSSDSTIIPQAKATFGVSEVVESLSTGVYLIAFGVGSLFSGPFSETVGRNPVYITTLILFMVFTAAAGVAPNIGSQLVFRFFAGLFGCTAVTTFAGTVADLWGPAERALVFTLASTVNFCGVFLAATVGAYIGQDESLSWRWTEWLVLILAAFVTAMIVLFAPETYGPLILSWKAANIRQQTGKSHHRSKHELHLEPLPKRLWKSTHRPFVMLFTEISVALFTVYLTVLYIVTFTFLTGYSYIYEGVYRMSQGSVGLCFLGLDVGILLATAIAIPVHRRHAHKLAGAGQTGIPVPPEYRLWFSIITAPCLPAGLFIMGWTANPEISYWWSLAGSVLIGIPFLGIFISAYLYMMDSFEEFAASALSISTVVRYVAAGAMIPVSIPMYENLGIHWTLTLLGCLSAVLTPVPFVMWKYGYKIRKRSERATNGRASM